MQARLQHDPDALEPLGAKLPVDGERGVGRRGVLHVDPDEVAALLGAADDPGDVLAGEVPVEAEAEPRRLDADVRVEPLAADRLEDVHVLVDERERLAPPGDFFAEDVDRRLPATSVQILDRPAGIGELGARDVALREPPHDRPRHGREHPDECAVEKHRAGF